MDSKGCWRDNVFIERLWKSVKYEGGYLKACDSIADAKYAHRYLAEAQYRFNLASILARLSRSASLTPPRPAPLIQPANGCRQSGGFKSDP